MEPLAQPNRESTRPHRIVKELRNKLTREEGLTEELTWGDLGWIHWLGQTERVPDPTGW